MPGRKAELKGVLRGNPVVHFELWSPDPDRVGGFYERAFGWKVNFHEGMGSWLVDTGGEGGINGGIMTPKEGPWPG
jgi:predicted enzyme related to lactoylglutathione lyase